MSVRQAILNNLKNIYGWQTNRKFVVFSVDDYGNVRLDSKQAREKLDSAGMKVQSRFDAFDTLETRTDLEELFGVLSSVKDKTGRHAVFTPFVVPCNIDFEKMAKERYQTYHYELLPTTYAKLAVKDPGAYEKTWDLWQEGLLQGLMSPQFHGREHLNLKLFEEKLVARDREVLTCLANRSYTSLAGPDNSKIAYNAAFDFWDFAETCNFKEIISSGLDAFEAVYGYRSIHFTPPGGRENTTIHRYLKDGGILFVDMPLVKLEHLGHGRYKRSINYTGKKNRFGITAVVRNVVFEPTHNSGIDWIAYAVRQIEAAFRWRRPANISSHRVNYCGHISPQNRQEGLAALKGLLKEIVTRWPDAEFVSSAELMAQLERE